MKKVAIVGLGWLGMPLAMSLSARGWQVTGSKTTQDGVEAARMSGIDSYLLRMEPELVCDSDDLDALMDADAQEGAQAFAQKRPPAWSLPG